MGDRLAHHECADQVLDGSSLAAVGPEVEGVQTSVEGGWFKKSAKSFYLSARSWLRTVMLA